MVPDDARPTPLSVDDPLWWVGRGERERKASDTLASVTPGLEAT